MKQPDEEGGERSQGRKPQPYEPVFNLSPVVLGLIGVCAVVHLIRAYLLSPVQDSALLLRLAFIPARYSAEYTTDIYSLVSPVTYSFLHGNFAHLAINMVWLAAFGSPLANRIGALRFMVFWVVTVLASVALYYLLHRDAPVPLVGASGAISGMMGAAARFAFRIDRSQARGAFTGPLLAIPAVLRSRTAVVFLVVWMVINLAAGLGFGDPEGNAQIAWEAHIGGFLAGFFGIVFLDRRPPPPPEPTAEPPAEA